MDCGEYGTPLPATVVPWQWRSLAAYSCGGKLRCLLMGTRPPYRPEDALGRGWTIQRNYASAPERGNGIAQRFPDGDSQHQRRLAYRLAAEDHTGFSGARQKLHVK